MKLRFLVLVLIGLMATSTFAATIGQWIQDPAGDPVTLSGNWSTGTMWKSGGTVPAPTTNTGDELKLNTPYATTTIDTDLANYNCKLTVAGGTDAGTVHTVLIQGSASGIVDVGAFQVGHGNSSSQGWWGKVVQSGGTVSAEKLVIGLYGTRGRAVGSYTISGGTLQGNSSIGGSDRLLVGCGMTTGSTIDNSEGTFTVEGKKATITMKELYVGGYTGVGTGNLVFKADGDGISPIKVSDSINLSDSGVANLSVSITNHVGDLLLVENTGTGSAVSVLFDSLNGGDAGEGDTVILRGRTYTLTYLYAAGIDEIANDIALIPEPATIALLGLGLIAIRRKK